MKTMLLILLLIPALASAQYPLTIIKSETWTAYCEGTTEKVKVSFVLGLGSDPIFYEYWQGEWSPRTPECTTIQGCAGPDNPGGTVTPLGSGLYEFRWDYPLECFGSEIKREGHLWWQELVDGNPEHRYVALYCADGPKPILDTATCEAVLVSESWATYCNETNHEFVRGVLVYHLPPGLVVEQSSARASASAVYCEGPGYVSNAVSIVALGGDDYAFTWQVPRNYLAGPTVLRFGRLTLQYIKPWLVDFYCDDGVQPIVDEADCGALPVATSTWGAVKAMYR